MDSTPSTTAVDAPSDGGVRALVSGTALIVAGVLPGFLTASLAPRIRDAFAFGDSSLGVAIAVFYAVSCLGSVPCGRLVERIGAVRGMRLAAAGTAVSCAAVAAFAGSTAGLVALLLPAGVGNAMGGPAVSALLKRAVHVRRQGLAFGAQQSGASIGALLAGLALPAVAIPFGWRWAFLAAGALAVAAVAFAPRPVAGAQAPAERGPHAGGLTSVHALGLAAVLASAAGVGFVSFLVTYAVHAGIAEATAGLLLGGVSFAATASRIGFGALTDRGDREPLRSIVLLLAVSGGCYLLLSAREPALIAAAALMAGATGWSWPGALTHAVVQRSPQAPAWAVGVMMSGLFAGAVAGPLIVGLLAEHDAFTAAWATCAALALASAVTIEATRRRGRPAPPAD